MLKSEQGPSVTLGCVLTFETIWRTEGIGSDSPDQPYIPINLSMYLVCFGAGGGGGGKWKSEARPSQADAARTKKAMQTKFF